MQTGWGRGVAILNRVTWQDLGNKVTLSEGASRVVSQGKGVRAEEGRARKSGSPGRRPPQV